MNEAEENKSNVVGTKVWIYFIVNMKFLCKVSYSNAVCIVHCAPANAYFQISIYRVWVFDLAQLFSICISMQQDYAMWCESNDNNQHIV